jgi:hypothetical protein
VPLVPLDERRQEEPLRGLERLGAARIAEGEHRCHPPEHCARPSALQARLLDGFLALPRGFELTS